MVEKLIIDVDTGVDDAQALMLALSRPDFEVVGITCVAGNVDIDQVCLNTLKVLSVCGRLDIPVYKGCNRPMIGEGFQATNYHGLDGLGDAGLDLGVTLDQVQKEHAVSALLRLVHQYPGELTLVALAPLTNIALALKQDPEFGKKLKRVTIMGGNVQGVGNITLCGEFNFACDPDAAFVVLSEMCVPLTLSPWEINLTTATDQPWEWFDKWIETDSAKGRFNKAVTKDAVHKHRDILGFAVYRSCDLNAMATVIDPGIVKSTKDLYATVELHGKFTRGMMVVDWYGILEKPPNVTVIREIDTERTRPMFESML